MNVTQFKNSKHNKFAHYLFLLKLALSVKNYSVEENIINQFSQIINQRGFTVKTADYFVCARKNYYILFLTFL